MNRSPEHNRIAHDALLQYARHVKQLHALPTAEGIRAYARDHFPCGHRSLILVIADVVFEFDSVDHPETPWCYTRRSVGPRYFATLIDMLHAVGLVPDPIQYNRLHELSIPPDRL